MSEPFPFQYVVLHQSVRNDMGKLAVFAAHAAGEACLHGPAPSDTRVFVLEAKTSEALVELGAHLAGASIECVLVTEPDEPYRGAPVALGTTPTRDRERLRPFFKDFKVLR